MYKTTGHMRHLFKRLLILSVVLTSACPYASAIYPTVRNFSKNDYRSGTQNWDIIQNEGGCMYFANNGGLLEFDGQEWETYPISNYTNVRSVFREQGRIYAGAFNEFGYYSIQNGAMQYTSLTDRFSGIDNISEIWKINKCGGTFYLQENSRIIIYDGRQARAEDIGEKITASACINGKIYVASQSKGIMVLDDSGHARQLEGCSAQLAGKKTVSILPIIDNGLIIVTETHGIFIYDSSGKLHNMMPPSKIRESLVFCAATDGRNLAIGTVSDGVYVLDMERSSVIHLNTFSGLQNNSVLSMYFDSSGNLWLGLDKGIDYVILNSPETSIFSSSTLYGTGYASLVHDRKLYLGTNQGLYYIDYPVDSPEITESSPIPVKGVKGQVWDLMHTGNTLFCGHDHGVYIIHRDSATRIPGINGTWKLEEMPEYPGHVLGCSYDGLFILEEKNGKWQLMHHIKGFSESSSTFEIDKDGTIWMHHWMKGLFRLTLNERKDSVVKIDYMSTNKGFPTERNNITNKIDGEMVFSSEGGYYRYDKETDKFVPYDYLNRLFNRPPVAAKVYETPDRNLIFLSGTLQAIAFRSTGSYTIDSTSMKFLQNRRIPGFDNITWLNRDCFILNTEDGFSKIDIRKLNRPADAENYSVFIKRVSVSENMDSLVFGARSSVDPDSGDIRIRYSENSVRFESACPRYRENDEIEYSHYLENYDNNWSPYSLSAVKEYTKLPKGTYIFHIRARDVTTMRITESSCRLTVLPPWYQENWAIALYSLLSALAVYTLMRIAGFKAEKKARELEIEKEKEIKQQQMKFEQEAKEREKEIIMLRNQTLEYDLKHKSQDLANSTMNLIRKNEILIKIKEGLKRVQNDMQGKDSQIKAERLLSKIQRDIQENIEHDDDWQKFEQNFDIAYEDYLHRLKERFPQLTMGDMKLCAYLKMDLCSKDIASLLNMSVRSVEMARYRLRKKLELSRDTNLSDFLQNF